MTKLKALETLIRNNTHFRKTYMRILNWNEKLTAKELAKDLSTKPQQIHVMSRMYKLKYKKHLNMGAKGGRI